MRTPRDEARSREWARSIIRHNDASSRQVREQWGWSDPDDAAQALAEAAREVIRSADASDTWTSLIGILDEAQAAYRAARGEEA